MEGSGQENGDVGHILHEPDRPEDASGDPLEGSPEHFMLSISLSTVLLDALAEGKVDNNSEGE